MTRETDAAITRKSLMGSNYEPDYSGVLSFLRRNYSRDLTNVDIAVTGIPYDLSVTNRPGTRFGPRALREASALISNGEVPDWGFDPFDKIAVVDYGDCGVDSSAPELIPKEIETHISQILNHNCSTFTLGGDHFISYPILKAYAEKFGKGLSLIQFDAHYDTWNERKGPIEHGTMFHHATTEGLIDPEKSVQIGIRSFIEDTLGFNVLNNHWVHKKGCNKVAKKVKDIVGDNLCYLSFDIDCLDPAFAPGTGTPVVGGISTYQAQKILRGLEGINIIGMDLVEVSPAYDVSGITALAGATLAMDMMCIFASKP
ncbi:MAG: agmatinase [Gammaproteobacteria bacterium]|nr:agmatinase [Gammaproteobacteria bacterium]